MTRLILLLLLMIPIVFAGIDVEHECTDFLCVEGTPVTFTFDVFNNLNNTLVIDNFFVIEMNTQEILAFHDQDVFAVPTGESLVLNLTTPARMPVSGFTYYYLPCVNASVDGGNLSKFVCGETIRTLTVTPKEKVDCIGDEDCGNGFICLDGRHICQKLECADDEAILPHSCLELSCGKYEVAENHACVGNNYIIPVFIAVLLIIIVAAIILLRKDNTSAIVDETGKAQKIIRRRRRK